MTSKRINLNALDFQDIKNNLKQFLQGQTQFQDYDFEGSNMSVLLDILAYNTHYNAMYMNMSLNEVFLDSASLRSSVTSIASSLGYIPRSARGARTTVQFAIVGVPSPGVAFTIPKYSVFNGVKDGVRYSFRTVEEITAPYNSGTAAFEFTDVELVEGEPVKSVFVYNNSNKFVLPNRNCDTSTLNIRVQDSGSSTEFDLYTLSTDFSVIDSESKVFFLRDIDETYQISFGDGILGRQLSPGNVITIEYFVCNGEEANAIRALQYEGETGSGSIQALTLLEPTSGGRFPETTEQIRFNAPNFYASQNRAVTTTDYESILLSKVPSIESVSVWGGEDNVPPIYGKIFISAKTASGRNLSFKEQQDIVNNVLNEYKIATVLPEFVNPDYIEVQADIVAYYDKALTNKLPETLRSDITNAVIAYDESELQQFNKILRRSVLSRVIENVDQSIISCVPRFRIGRTITPVYNKTYTYDVYVGNPFKPGTILSGGFYIPNDTSLYFVDDDGEGNLNLFTLKDGARNLIRTTGTVDYSNGSLQIESLNIARIEGSDFKVFAEPSSADIASINNQIVLLNQDLLRVSVIADTTTKGRALTGNKFIFTSSSI